MSVLHSSSWHSQKASTAKEWFTYIIWCSYQMQNTIFWSIWLKEFYRYHKSTWNTNFILFQVIFKTEILDLILGTCWRQFIIFLIVRILMMTLPRSVRLMYPLTNLVKYHLVPVIQKHITVHQLSSARTRTRPGRLSNWPPNMSMTDLDQNSPFLVLEQTL